MSHKYREIFIWIIFVLVGGMTTWMSWTCKVNHLSLATTMIVGGITVFLTISLSYIGYLMGYVDGLKKEGSL